ncbi:3-deoxy-D-manno-octulosonic acid kinase [Marinimicrobium sp. LS-A18]|uniref:3-deoxy-D-manno-octulosonic acid kinase n=1 Tax=Marinimicrobium sp. LS-A18 TaxID=1381596 RepID=UPI0004637952|nr:3-deoxy-D-manno-octulosonic acid kinase [Marinimicrobium sp. LS-A18]
MTNATHCLYSDGSQHALVHPAQAEAFQFQWFDPAAWGASAELINSGGRGAAWFLNGDRGRWVLRHYRRGGLPGKLLDDRYCYLGSSRVRALWEFSLLQSLSAEGLPVPTPIAAWYERKGLTYRAALIIERLENTQSLLSLDQTGHLPLWEAAGRCIRRFHDAGVYHADLNATNVLVRPSSGEVFLIDFDRGAQHASHTADAPWKAANLARLERGVHKHWGAGTDNTPEPFLKALKQGYA